MSDLEILAWKWALWVNKHECQNLRTFECKTYFGFL